MLKVIGFSLIALVVVYWVAQSLGLTPEQIEDQILLAELNAEEGAAFRAKHARQSGILSWDDGIQVEILEMGDGDIPDLEDWVQVHYRGWHIDGREFENSWRRGEPATVTVARMIPGWREVLRQIPEGTRIRFVLPPDLAYGRAGGGQIGPEETLAFELEFLRIVQPEVPAPRQEWEQPVPGLR